MFLKKIFKKIVVFSDQIIIEKTSTPIIILIATFSTFILYKLFFAFSNIIWSMNLKVNPNDLSPQIRGWLGERDGIETYALYILVFACIFLTILLIRSYDFLKLRNKIILLVILLSIFFSDAYFYFTDIGFNFPMPNQAKGVTPFIIMAIVFIVLWLLIKIASKKEKLADILIIIFLIPICFIAVAKISIFDYSFIFAPALRILKNFELKDIYFQYDLLLSGIATIWMKLNINLNYFQVIGQFSFYALFLASFFFSKKFFIKKKLAYYLLISLVLVKIYGLMHDPILVFQVTPLRIDWWLLILIVSFSRGIYSKLLGFILAALIIFHKTFGLIYVISYFEIIFVLFLFDLIYNKISLESCKNNIKKHFNLCLPNIIIIFISFVINLLIFNGASIESAYLYQQIGIGFIQISKISFYWYFLVLVSATVAILFLKRNNLSINYFNSSLLLIALSIGNSIYFFGRSHEHNIINISASLIFVLFLFFDLVLYHTEIKTQLQSKYRKIISVLLPSSFIVLIIFFYSAGIRDKVITQFHNILNHQTIYPLSPKDLFNISKVKKLTHNSDKLYFTGPDDFYYYYYGNYIPQGHFSPYASWVYKKDMVDFMQKLLNNGYYIVSPGEGTSLSPNPDSEILSNLRYNNVLKQDGFTILW